MKKYLNTPKEVIDALQAGKKVETEDLEYKFINGILVATSKTNKHWIVYPALSASIDHYINESKSLKLEVGKFYKTRDGRKAIVLNVVKDDTRSCPVRVVVVDNTYEPYFVRKSGHLYKNEENAWDIVAPWEE